MRNNYIRKFILAIVIVILAVEGCVVFKKEPKKLACIGDSITYGHGINNRVQNSYPAQLAEILGTKWNVRNFGVSGATLLRAGDISYWNQEEYIQALEFNPDIVVIMLGSNDSKPWNWEENNNYIKDYISLIDSFRNLQAKPVIWLCNPVPAFKTEWGINDSIIRNEIIPRISKIALIEHIKVIDLYSPFINKGEFFPDYIHPDSTGASLLASYIAKAIN